MNGAGSYFTPARSVGLNGCRPRMRAESTSRDFVQWLCLRDSVWQLVCCFPDHHQYDRLSRSRGSAVTYLQALDTAVITLAGVDLYRGRRYQSQPTAADIQHRSRVGRSSTDRYDTHTTQADNVQHRVCRAFLNLAVIRIGAVESSRSYRRSRRKAPPSM